MEGENAIRFPGFPREMIDAVIVLEKNSFEKLTGLLR